jgi:hypothetical protein
MGDLAQAAVLIAVVATVVFGLERMRRRSGERSQPAVYAPVHVMGNQRDGTGPDTYRAAYELILRGVDVRMEMQELWREQPRVLVSWAWVGGETHVASRKIYTTDLFKPHLDSIKSIADFNRYAPYRHDRRLLLAVHPDHFERTLAILREVGIQLSVVHHPDQQ